MDILGGKFRTLQKDLSAAIHEKNILGTKLIELDQLVGQLLSVNESLVVRLSGKPLVKGQIQPSQATATKKKKVIPQHTPKASVPTKASLRERSQTVSNSTPETTFDDVKNLHGMHKMYVNLVHSITDSHVPKILRKVRRASTGGEVTGRQLNSSTMIRSKKLLSQDDHQNNDDDTYINDISVRIPSISTENRYSDESINNGQFSNTNNSGNFGTTLYENNSDLQRLIVSLEEEFDLLNSDYRHLLGSVQAQSSSADSSLADELVIVIQKLHKKGEQLRALKSTSRR